MASPERYFFLHLQKTAGTALWRRLNEVNDPAALYPGPGDGSPPLTTLSVDHLLERWAERRHEIRIVAGHFPLCTTELLDATFRTFTVLRDPVERTLSFLRHHKQTAPEDAERSLESIYEDPLRQQLVVNHMTKMLSMTTDEMTGGALSPIEADDAHISRACERLGEVDVVGIQERFDEFCAALEHRFSWSLGKTRFMNRTQPVEVTERFRRRIAADNEPDRIIYEEACRLQNS